MYIHPVKIFFPTYPKPAWEKPAPGAGHGRPWASTLAHVGSWAAVGRKVQPDDGSPPWGPWAMGAAKYVRCWPMWVRRGLDDLDLVVVKPSPYAAAD